MRVVSRIRAILPTLLMAAIMTVRVSAHCDTMGGPVIETAKAALESGDVTPILKWVKPEYESTIKEAFEHTMAVRGESPQARELADMYFFETLVRLHRAGEGAPYTGLKTETEIEPIIELSDKALDSGRADSLINLMSREILHGIEERFARVLDAAEHQNESIKAGRDFVEAYVTFTHYVEGIHRAIAGGEAHHGQE